MSRGPPTHALFDPENPISPLSIPAANTAVLLMDYQNLIVGMLGPAGSSTVEAAVATRDWALEQGIRVYHCLIRMDGPNSTPPPQSRLNERVAQMTSKIQELPELSQEVASLAIQDASREEIATRRPGHISALYSDGLEEELKRQGVRSLILAGLSTSGCVLSTVRGANDQGYITTVVADSVADPIPQLHDLLINNTIPSTAHVATIAMIRAAWKQGVA